MNEHHHYQNLYEAIHHNGTLMYAGHLLKRAAHLWPESVAVICQDVEITYENLYLSALRVSQALHDAGIGLDKRVMLLYENSINFYIAYYGIWQLGAVVVPVNTMLHSAELEHILKNAQPHGVIISSTLYTKFESVIKSVPLIITEKDLSSIDMGPEFDESKLPTRDPDELSVLLYTSGTTGIPKGVMLSSRNILMNCIQGGARFSITSADRAFAALPLFHSYTQNTCMWLCTLLGTTTIIVPKIERKLLLQGLKHKPTFILGIPQLYGLFCLMRKAPFGSVRYFVSGGDALPDRIRAGFELIYNRKICNGYGLTESSPFISVDIDDMLKPPETVGAPFIGIQCQIRDDKGTVLDHKKVGVLWIKGENVMLGYYDNPESTAAVIVDGWLNTGDLAMITTGNKIVLSGREKDLIKSKGIKVYPQEIENVLMGHPKILAAAVIGQIRDDEEVPVAYVVARHPDEKLEQELRDLCASKLASYEIPRAFIIKEQLPTTATGKIDKKVLKKLNVQQ
jgi:long-chain acyl-CoA synthetase